MAAPQTAPVGRAVNDRSGLRLALGVTLILLLGLAVWLQRDTIGGAVRQMRSLSGVAIAALVVLTVYERWSRADIVRRLLCGGGGGGDIDDSGVGEADMRPESDDVGIGMGRAVTIHDVGNAVSKGMPMGGAVGTAMRWSIVRDSGLSPARFATMLIAYGIATTFVSWLLPFTALLVDLTQRSPDATDLLILGGIAVVVSASALFWVLTLRSDRLEAWTTDRTRTLWERLARRVPAAATGDPSRAISEVRSQLTAIVHRPVPLLIRAAAAQACGSVILFVALRGVGVGDELAVTEFFRVFFITHLLGTFAPTPGGVGVVEAGMTGALTAAGVDTEQALAGVLVYRFLTYVVPIVFGASLWVWWKASQGSRARARAGERDPDPAAPDRLPLEDGRLRGH